MSNRPNDKTDRSENRTMGDASHTNPYTGESFGETVAYSRGRVVAADGGRANAAEEDTEEAREETIGDMDHTPRRDAPDASGVYERGAEAE